MREKLTLAALVLAVGLSAAGCGSAANAGRADAAARPPNAAPAFRNSFRETHIPLPRNYLAMIMKPDRFSCTTKSPSVTLTDLTQSGWPVASSVVSVKS